MLLKGENLYYHRDFYYYLRAYGLHIICDLVPLYDMLTNIKRLKDLSREAKLRIKWFDYYLKTGNAAQTCKYFGISRKTFYKWKKRYDPMNLVSLEDKDRAPVKRRQREITPKQLERVIKLRKRYIRWGKIKLSKVYEQEYQEQISSWKIQKVIEEFQLYYNPAKTARIRRKRQRAIKKKRITELKKKPKNGFLLCLDTIVIHLHGLKRYIFTGIDSISKVAFARMYKNANSYNASDFLSRLHYLLDGKIENLQTDNGSEFEKYFAQACKNLEIERYYNRPRTPKDNPVNERFNRTLEDEFVSMGKFHENPEICNHRLTEWVIEYNFKRPHETLGYETPINFNNSARVSPMYPSCT